MVVLVLAWRDVIGPAVPLTQEVGYGNGGTFHNFMFTPGPAPVGRARPASRIHVAMEKWLVRDFCDDVKVVARVRGMMAASWALTRMILCLIVMN